MLIIGAVLALAAILLALAAILPKPQSVSGGSEILITVGGGEWGR